MPSKPLILGSFLAQVFYFNLQAFNFLDWLLAQASACALKRTVIIFEPTL
jgi:hypothetical protein